jgi:hypothetical protein
MCFPHRPAITDFESAAPDAAHSIGGKTEARGEFREVLLTGPDLTLAEGGGVCWRTSRAQTRSAQSRGLQRSTGLASNVCLRTMARMLPYHQCSQQKEGVMSQAGVGMVVDKLLTDQNVRIGLALDPWETVADLLLQGFDLTGDEIALFCQTDPRVWFLGEMASGEPERHELRRSAFA